MRMVATAEANAAAIAAVMVGIVQMIAVAFGAAAMAKLHGILKRDVDYEKDNTVNPYCLPIGDWMLKWMHTR